MNVGSNFCIAAPACFRKLQRSRKFWSRPPADDVDRFVTTVCVRTAVNESAAAVRQLFPLQKRPRRVPILGRSNPIRLVADTRGILREEPACRRSSQTPQNPGHGFAPRHWHHAGKAKHRHWARQIQHMPARSHRVGDVFNCCTIVSPRCANSFSELHLQSVRRLEIHLLKTRAACRK